MGKPKIRFKGFDDDWEQRKLGEITVKIGSGKTPSGGKSAYVETGIPLIRSQNVNNDKVDFADVVYIDKSTDESMSNSRVYTNDVLLNITGASIGRSAVYKGVESANVNQHVCIIRQIEGYQSDFIQLNLSSDNGQKQIDASQAGGGREGLNFQEIGKMQFSFPTLNEQKCIGRYFNNLDHLITLHQRKCDETKKLKKYMLQKMFPQNGQTVPEIRFSGFTDVWEQRKWMNSVDISTEMVDPASGEYDDMPHIAPGNIESFTGRILDNVRTVKEEQLISGKFRFRPDDVVYGKINPQLGKYFYASVDGLTSADAYVFKGKNGIRQKFLFSMLQTSDFFKYSVSVSKRSGMPKINRDELNAYAFLAPSEEEQDKIGNFLLEIDHLITLHQQKCDELRNIKKFMLQNMFA